jgi:hypothetical protein
MICALRREGADPVRTGRPWSLPLEARVLLVAAYWRTILTLRQLAPLFGVSNSAADRMVDDFGPALALQPRSRIRRDTVLIADGTLVPTRDHTVVEQSKNCRYPPITKISSSTPTHDCRRCRLVVRRKEGVGKTTVIPDGGYRGTGLVIPHRREKGQTELPAWKAETSQVHARRRRGQVCQHHHHVYADLGLRR